MPGVWRRSGFSPLAEPDRAGAIKERVRQFIDGEVIPQEPVLHAGGEAADAEIARLKARAKELGLWALGHPSEIGGGGLPVAGDRRRGTIIDAGSRGRETIDAGCRL